VAIGHRLVRKLCEHGRTTYTLTPEERTSLSAALSEELLRQYKEFSRADGCAKCNNTGYSRRIGIYEILEVTDAIRQLIMHRANADEIRTTARKEGMTTMLEDGLAKAGAGVTSIAEILRVIHD
ncbi:MAG: type II secretion system protein GspE, partial [bacterium]|nr:type II secretion system protein GspE [bacterium]